MLVEPLGSAEPRLKITDLVNNSKQHQQTQTCDTKQTLQKK